MSGRDRVLARVRAALSDVPREETPTDAPVPREYERTRTGPDVVELLVDRLVDYKAEVRLVSDATAEGPADAASARIFSLSS